MLDLDLLRPPADAARAARAAARLDITAHNIANAKHQGYSRQEVTSAPRRPATSRPASLVDGGGAQLGSGVDVTASPASATRSSTSSTARRTCELGDADDAPADRSSRSSSALAEPGDNGISGAARQVLERVGRPRQHPGRRAARQALDRAGQDARRRSTTLDAQLTTVDSQAQREYTALTGAGRRRQGYATEIATLNDAIKQPSPAATSRTTCSTAATCCSTSSPTLGQVSVTDNGDGSIDVNFGDAADPLVDGTHGQLAADADRPGRQARRADRPDETGGTIDGYRARPERGRQDARRRASTRSTTRAAPAPLLQLHGRRRGWRARRERPDAQREDTSTAAAGANDDRARDRAACAAARPTQLYAASSARIGADVQRRQARRDERAASLTERDRGPPPERLRRLDGRGDDEHHPLPARLPGLGASDDDDRRDARHADQPHREGLGARASPPSSTRCAPLRPPAAAPSC